MISVVIYEIPIGMRKASGKIHNCADGPVGIGPVIGIHLNLEISKIYLKQDIVEQKTEKDHNSGL